MAQTPTIDHATLNQALDQARIGAGASDVHGSLCGFLCAGGSSEGDWMASLAIDRGDIAHQGRDLLAALLAFSQHQLDDPEFTFQPLLPGDARPLSVRAEALAAWCQGFLGGFGVGPGSTALGEDAREVLRDIAGIAGASFESEEAAEEDETAYAELLEYVRVGVLYLRGEATAGAMPAGRTH